MSCDRARRLFGACWDDELTHAEREWLEAHLAVCARCRDEYEAHTRTLELVGALPRIEAPPDLVERVLARSRHAAVAPDGLGAARVRWAPALAAAAAVVVLAVAVMLVLPRAPWHGPGAGDSSPVAVSGGDPAMPVLVSEARPEAAGSKEARPAGKATVVADDPFDHSADVEFILDPVSVNRGRATVSHAGSRQADTEGERTIISF